MKLKALLLACAVAGFTASFALADDGGHHGKHHGHIATTAKSDTTTTTVATTTTNAAACSEVELTGKFASVSPTSFTLTLTKAEAADEDNDDDDNGAAAPTFAAGQTVTVAVDANTRVSFNTLGTLAGPATGDSAKVKALACGTPATLTAQRVRAEGAAAAAQHESKSEHSSKSHK